MKAIVLPSWLDQKLTEGSFSSMCWLLPGQNNMQKTYPRIYLHRRIYLLSTSFLGIGTHFSQCIFATEDPTGLIRNGWEQRLPFVLRMLLCLAVWSWDLLLGYHSVLTQLSLPFDFRTSFPLLPQSVLHTLFLLLIAFSWESPCSEPGVMTCVLPHQTPAYPCLPPSLSSWQLVIRELIVCVCVSLSLTHTHSSFPYLSLIFVACPVPNGPPSDLLTSLSYSICLTSWSSPPTYGRLMLNPHDICDLCFPVRH